MLDFGTIIHGTLRPEDVGPALVRTLNRELVAAGTSALDDPERAQSIGYAYEIIEEMGQCRDWHYSLEEFWHEEGDYWCIRLLDILTELALPYAYVGAHPGDGADIGVWPSYDTLDELVSVDDPSRLDDLPLDVTEAVEVNDHGNMTLHERTPEGWRSVWSLV